MKFETLFTDPRHFRGDCVLVRTAIRRGWVRPEDRAALMARVEAAWEAGWADTDAAKRAGRGLLRLAMVWVEMDRDNARALRQTWTGGRVGRPPKRG